MLDEEFEFVWDAGGERWEVWKFPKEKMGYHVLTIQTKDKSYREIGADILLKIREIQSFHFDAKKIMDYLMESERQERRRKAKDFMNKIEAIAKDTFNYSRGVLQVDVPAKIEFEVPKSQLIEGAVRDAGS